MRDWAAWLAGIALAGLILCGVHAFVARANACESDGHHAYVRNWWSGYVCVRL